MDRAARELEITSPADTAPARLETGPVRVEARAKLISALRPSKAGASRVLRSCAIFVSLLLVVILLQWLGSAYSGEFSGADEPAHFVTGLMIRDYIASGFPSAPVAFAEKYYLHYPRVAFAMWGPLLHITEAAWTLVFPPSRITILLLMALITAATAALLYGALVDEFGMALALMAALLFIATPAVQHYTGMVMADGLVALLDFCAAMAFGRYLNTQKSKHVLLFAAFVCLSILTKGNGVALVLLPLFAILFTRQFGILKKRSLWIAAGIIVCIAGPWQYYSAKALLGIADRHAGWTFFFGYARTILHLVGLALSPVIAVGVWDRLIVPAWQRSLDGKWAAAGALLCSVWAFHSLIPAEGVELRYLIAVVPPILLFLTAGISGIAGRVAIPSIDWRRRSWGVAALVAIVFLTTAFSIPKKQHYGFDAVAELLETPEYRSNVVLISSAAPGAEGEGMLISEVAMREKRPSHIVLRATKMLSQSDWMGAHYTLLYQNPDEVMKFLKSIPVGIVVVHNERGLAGSPDHRLLQQTIAGFSTEWEHLRAYTEGESTIDVYHLKSAAGQRTGTIRIDLPYTLGRSIEY
jgi:hypothetical protein